MQYPEEQGYDPMILRLLQAVWSHPKTLTCTEGLGTKLQAVAPRLYNHLHHI